MKIAIVCDWLEAYGGAERVLEQLLEVFPAADVFAVVDFVSEGERQFLRNKSVTTTFIQRLPFAKSKYRSYLPLMPLAVEQLDLSAYDVVISSSHCVAKGVLTGPNQLHISYVHSPIRYAWDMQHQYLHETGLDKGLKGWLARMVMHYMRLWDMRTSNGVDYFIANSRFIAKRIYKCYHRRASVIYPPVDVSGFTCCEAKEDFYLTVSRMVPYKRMDILVEAFSKMPDKRLVVIGTGSEFAKCQALAGANVQLLGYQPTDTVRDYMQRAKAFLFAAEEDFGIAPLEAQACGTPVIAYGRGGALETVRGLDKDAPTGVFFAQQTAEAVCAAVQQFEARQELFSPQNCRHNAEQFATERFCHEIKAFVEKRYKKMYE